LERTPENIDRYVSDLFAPESKNGIYSSALETMSEGGLPSINVSASLGKTLHVLTLAVRAKRILEIGTLGGYSGLWLASALPADGKMVTLELEPKHAEVARKNFERAGLGDKVEIRVGPALETLEEMVKKGETGFDITFIDANKDGYVDYLEKALLLTRKGGLVLADNALTHNVLDKPEDSPIARFNEALSRKNNLTTTLIPTLREVIDGLTISVVR
jgi:predicted O-methyltransferase YrrM